jgi:hypothetical protein
MACSQMSAVATRTSPNQVQVVNGVSTYILW